MTIIQQKTQIAYPTFEKFLDDYKPAQLIVVYADINTISRSIAVISPRLRLEDISVIYSTAKRNAGVDYIENWLNFLNKFSNLNKQLTETKAVAFMIYNKYKFYYLTDLKVIFEKIMQCEYGIFYGSVDAPRILGAFVQYSQEREAAINHLTTYIKSELKAYITPLEMSEQKAISKSLEGKYTDDKQFRDECRRIFSEESYPKLQKLYTEMEEQLYKKYNETIR